MATDAEMLDLVHKFVAAGSNDWKKLYEANIAVLDGGEVDRAADAAAVSYAKVAGYVESRRSGASHDLSMMHAARAAKAVRKALGYTHP